MISNFPQSESAYSPGFLSLIDFILGNRIQNFAFNMAKVNRSDLLELFEAKIVSGKIVVTRCFQVESVSILEIIFGRHFIQVLQGLMILFLHKITVCVHDVTLAVGRVK
jgi:hypothetical protein